MFSLFLYSTLVLGLLIPTFYSLAQENSGPGGNCRELPPQTKETTWHAGLHSVGGRLGLLAKTMGKFQRDFVKE